MPELLPVTEDDKRAAWDALYTTVVAGHTYAAIEPKPAEREYDRILLDGLGRVLEADRRRVQERSQ